MNREMKDSRVEWIGEIPEDWETHKIKFGFTEVNYKNTDGLIKNALKFRYGNIVCKENFDADTEEYVADTILNYNVVKPGDIMINGLNLNFDFVSIRSAIVENIGVITSAYLALRPNEQIILPYYANYLFRSYDVCKAFHNMGIGMRKTLAFKEFKNQPCIFPSPTEQQQIVHFLDRKCTAIDTAIEKTKKSIEKLEEYKKAVITKAVTKGIDPNAKMKDSGVEWIGEIPEDWNIGRVKFLLDERNERSIYGKEEPLSMSQKIGIIPTKQMNQVPHMAASFVNAKICYPNDLVFNKLKAHLGVFSVSEYHGVVSPDYAVYFENKYSHAKYLEYLFKTPQCINEFKKRITGVGQGLSRLYTSELYDVIVPTPTKEEQIRIANEIRNKCEAINNLIKKKQTAINKLEEYKKSLIYYAVTGKIDCRGEEL
nr:restriction endonuclease subunit S [Clostridium sp. CM74B_53]